VECGLEGMKAITLVTHGDNILRAEEAEARKGTGRKPDTVKVSNNAKEKHRGTTADYPNLGVEANQQQQIWQGHRSHEFARV
jgi:hypothetical protein